MNVTGNLVQVGGTRTHDGPVTNWKQRIRRGVDATSTLTGSKTSLQLARGTVHLKYRQFGWRFSEYKASGNILGAGIPLEIPPDVTLADDRAKVQFVRKCNSARTALQGQVVMGELRETLRMLRNPAMALRRGLDDYFATLRKGRRGSSRQKRRFIAETWLEYSFGWTPLMNDIAAAAEVFRRLKYDDNVTRYIRAIGVDEQLLNTSTVNYSVGQANWNVGILRKSEAIVIYRALMKLPVSDKPELLRRNLGFNLHDFVPTLWELIPYSFLVDYFTNIGDIISGWSFYTGDLVWINRTQVGVVEERRNFLGLGPITGLAGYEQDQYTGSSGPSVAQKRSVMRSRYLGNFIPTFRLEIPGLGSTRWLNLAALARTQSRMTPF